MLVRVIGAMACVTAALAQSPATGPAGAKPKFDVASVKPCDPHTARGTFAGSTGRGRVSYTCQTLMSYVIDAYVRWSNGQMARGNLPANVEGGPAWVNTDLFQIDAKAEGEASVGMTAGPMMQSLLEERFHLKVHRETREGPAYALTAAKGGIRLPAAKVGCFVQNPGQPRPPLQPGQAPPPMCGRGRQTKDGIEVHGSTMADFSLALSGMPLRLDRRKIVDKTGIAGQFDFDLKFPPEDAGLDAEPGARAAFDPAADLARLQDALRGAGLQLTPAKAAYEFVVIDHAERPTAN